MGDGRVSDPVTTAEGVGEFIVFAELSTALSSRLAGWSTDGADPDTSATMASLAARLGEHAGWWMDRTPEAALLEGERTAASGAGRLTDILALLDIPPSDRRSAVTLSTALRTTTWKRDRCHESWRNVPHESLMSR